MSFVLRRKIDLMLMALGAAWLLFAAPGIWGQKASAAAMPPLPAEISIRIDAHPKTATVGDPIRLDLDISMPPGYQAEIPKPVAQSADFLHNGFFPGPGIARCEQVSGIRSASRAPGRSIHTPSGPGGHRNLQNRKIYVPINSGENKNSRGQRNRPFPARRWTLRFKAFLRKKIRH